MAATTAASRWNFLAWTTIGAAVSLGILTPFTVGLPLLIASAVGIGLLLWRHATRGAAGLLSGAGVLAFYIAYLNRQGPGDVCTNTATESHCVSEWSPWPWLIAGVLLVAAGVALYQHRSAGP